MPATKDEDPVPLDPLCCTRCGAPLPLGRGDAVLCPHCGASTEVPKSYRTLRDDARLAERDRRALEASYAAVMRPPPLPVRWWASLGRVFVGGLALLTVAATVAGFIGVLRIEGGVRGIYYGTVVAVAEMLIAVPVAFEHSLHLLGAHGLDLADELGPVMYVVQWAGQWIIAWVPARLTAYCTTSLRALRTMQRALAARPPARPGGPAVCRVCGAALDVPTGALGVRCLYCRTDNLVTLREEQTREAASRAGQAHREATEARATCEAERLQRRAMLPHRVAAGIKYLPLVFVLGSCGHCTMDNLNQNVATWHVAPLEEGTLFPTGYPKPPAIPLGHRVDLSYDPCVFDEPTVYGHEYLVALERGQRLHVDIDSPRISWQLKVHNPSWDVILGRPWVASTRAKRAAPYVGWYDFVLLYHYAGCSPHDRIASVDQPPEHFHVRVALSSSR